MVLVALSLVLACTQANPPPPPACSSCHGTPGDPAPPVALGGLDESPAIGAHTEHQVPSSAVAVACSECHVVPGTVDAPGHLGPVPAELTWGPLATSDGVDASFVAEGKTCLVYCHGASLGGGTVAAPGWNDGPAVVGCTSCHGQPPPPPHPANASCSNCHPSPGSGTHIDGIVQLGGA